MIILSPFWYVIYDLSETNLMDGWMDKYLLYGLDPIQALWLTNNY